MARIEGEIIIQRPVEEVFAFVADERNEPRYNPRMVSAELTSGEPIDLGSRFRAELKYLALPGGAGRIPAQCAGMPPGRLASVRVASAAEIYPFLALKDVDAAVAFYAEAFGATEAMERVVAPDGPQVALLVIEGQQVGVATEARDLGTPSPETVGVTTVRISLHVDDADAAQARAVAAGAREMFEVADQPYGLRQGRVVVPFGHHWLISHPL